MKCEVCENDRDKLFQVVMKVNEEVDTSAFSYRVVCDSCVEDKGLQKNVINEVQPDNA